MSGVERIINIWRRKKKQSTPVHPLCDLDDYSGEVASSKRITYFAKGIVNAIWNGVSGERENEYKEERNCCKDKRRGKAKKRKESTHIKILSWKFIALAYIFELHVAKSEISELLARCLDWESFFVWVLYVVFFFFFCGDAGCQWMESGYY